MTLAGSKTVFKPTDVCMAALNGPASMYVNANGTIRMLEAYADISNKLNGKAVQLIVRRLPNEHYVVLRMQIMTTPTAMVTSPVPAGSQSAPVTPMKRKMTLDV